MGETLAIDFVFKEDCLCVYFRRKKRCCLVSQMLRKVNVLRVGNVAIKEREYEMVGFNLKAIMVRLQA